MVILDADKEGFLRSERSLIQTIGRAARNAQGRVIMYADRITKSMQKALDETNRRRELQMEYNRQHQITPQTIQKSIRDVIEATKVAEQKADYLADLDRIEQMSSKELQEYLLQLEKEMQVAAKNLQFERAAELRDLIIELKG